MLTLHSTCPAAAPLLNLPRHRPRLTPAPDSLFDKARQDAEYNTKLDARQQAIGGIQTPAGSAGMATPLADLKQIGEARGTVLGVKLDQVRVTRPHTPRTGRPWPSRERSTHSWGTLRLRAACCAVATDGRLGERSDGGRPQGLPHRSKQHRAQERR